MPCGRVWSTSMSVAVWDATCTGIASASVASRSRIPRKVTGPPASHGSRLEARNAQRQLLARRGHPGRYDAAQPSPFDHERDPATVAPRAWTRTLVSPAQDRLHDRVGAPVLGHLAGGPERIRRVASWKHRRHES